MKLLLAIALMAISLHAADTNSDVKTTKIIKTIERVDGNSTQEPRKVIINIHLKHSNKCKVIIN